MIYKNWLQPLLIILLPGLSAQLHAEIRIDTEPNPRRIHAPRYDALIGSDGCLTSLRVDGQEFLAANVSISRGSYFYYQGPLRLRKIKQPAKDTITATGDLTSIQYTFSDDGMVWRLTNHADVELVFFMVFAGNLDGLRGGHGKIEKLPISGDKNRLTCFRAKVRLELAGFTRVWGPWQGPHQVGQVDLKPGEKKEITIRFDKTTPAEHQEIVELHSLPPDSNVTILSPREYQVFQRQDLDGGEILISGRCGRNVDKLEIRIAGDSTSGPLPDRWISIPTVSKLREFNFKKQIPAGGWYTLNVRAGGAGNVFAEKRVQRFGVGEVFVGAGQSNSTNCGEFKTRQQTGMVASFSGEAWQLADDPQPGVADRSQGGSFWPAFGDAMYQKYKVPIGLAATGYGGTSVNQWQRDGDLFKWMMTRIHQLGPGGFRALLWHQGESDVAMATDEYYAKLRNVILASRASAGWEFPWFVAQASYHNPAKPRFENIRAAQEKLWNNSVALAGPDTDTLTGAYRDLDGKGIHFSPKGLKAHGQMWAKRVGAYLDLVLFHGPVEKP